MKTNMIKTLLTVLLIISSTLPINLFAATISSMSGKVNSNFVFSDSKNSSFSEQNKADIKKHTNAAINKVLKIMPDLATEINFNIRLIDRDLTTVYGVTGRADKKDEIEISLSSIYKGGIPQAIKDGLAGTVYHELHHTVRGWTMYGNKFEQGIDIATINEGLADVFAEIQISRAMNKMSTNVDFPSWIKEIKALPQNANYGSWMNFHPDGREAIGYRTGAFIVKKAMRNSGKDIINLSYMSVKDIYKLAGY